MKWILFATLAALFYLFHDLLLQQVSDKLNPLLSGFLLSVAAAAALGIVIAVQSFSGNPAMGFTAKQLPMIGGAGILLAAATVSFIYCFEQGAPFSLALPYVYVVMIGLGAIIGVLFLKETLSPVQLAGIALCCVGLFLVVKK